MKKFVQNIWVRFIACLICAASVLGIVASVAGMVLFAECPNKQKALDEGNELLLENYALYALDHLSLLEENEIFDEINAYITIKKWEYVGEEDTQAIVTQQYSNMPEGVLPTFTMEEMYADSYKKYSTDSLLKALDAYCYVDPYDYMVSTPIEGYVFDANTGLFYYQTPVGYFLVDYIDVAADNESYDYGLITRNGKGSYINSYYNLTLNPAEYQSWDWVRIDGKKMSIGEGQSGNYIQLVTDSSIIETKLYTANYYVESHAIYYVSERVATYTVEMAMAESLVHQDLFYEYHNFINGIYQYQDSVVGIQWLCIVLFIIGMILLVVSAPEDRERLRFFHKTPVLIYTGLVVMVEVGLCMLIVLFFQVVTGNSDWTVAADTVIIQIINAVFVVLLLAFAYFATIITRIKTKTLFRYSEFYYISRPILYVYRLAQEHTSLFWKALLPLLGVSFVEFLVIITSYWNPEVLLGWFFAIKIIEIPLVIYALVQMKQLQEGSKRIASGDLTPIDTSKMFWEFKKHGENINQVREGIALAVEDQMKSERFKTELITNVSHDIKTPLTSIINYVDLIKKEDIADPTMVEYVEVLDRQSARLKKLIEDLMEASKASTGNIEVRLEECDMNVLITQVVGEFEEKLAAQNLEVIISKPEEPVNVSVDGRHMWRVLDNLLNNACKYSQPNTRVYISLTQEGKEAVITFRNISKEALNIPSDQLMQRFVRGDSSRHTEGSGLGLSIAQSLTELMKGSMKLDIDGDLFKVTLKFNIVA